MSVTVARIVGLPRLGLRVHAGQRGLDREVRWAATSELPDPTPFLEGGELLLSTGMNLPTSQPELGAYLDRLVGAGVAAFGLGLGLTFRAVPEQVVQAANERGLPLVSVPRPTPFIAVTRALADMISAEQRAELARALQVQRRLVDAALTRDGSQAVLRVLASALDGWAALLDTSGGVRLGAGESAYERAAALAPDVARLGGRSLHASASLDVAGDQVVLQPVGAAGRVSGVLAVGAPQRFSATRRAIVAGAVSVLSLEPDQARRSLDTSRAGRAAIMRLLLLGRVADAASVASAAGMSLPSDPTRTVIARVPGEHVGHVLGHLEDLASPAGSAPLVVLLDDRVVVVVTDEARVLKAVRAVLETIPDTCAGVSDSGSLSDLPAHYESARRALSAAEQKGRPWVDATQLGGLSLLGLLHPDLLSAHAETVLAPLAAYGRNHRDLLASLRSWLEHGGHWDETAAALGLHRNTLRYRIRRVEQLTGRDLSSMRDRVELWLALQANDLSADARREWRDLPEATPSEPYDIS